MCFEPITIATLVIGAVSAAASVSQGKQAADQADAQAIMTMQQADRDEQIAGLEAEQLKRKNRAEMARQRAALAASGVDLSSGTALLLQSDSAKVASFDENMVRAGARARADRAATQAGLISQSGRGDYAAGVTRAGTTLLGAGADAAKAEGLTFG